MELFKFHRNKEEEKNQQNFLKIIIARPFSWFFQRLFCLHLQFKQSRIASLHCNRRADCIWVIDFIFISKYIMCIQEGTKLNIYINSKAYKSFILIECEDFIQTYMA